MPALVLIAAPAGAQPRLRFETLSALKAKGFELDRRLESSTWNDLFDETMTPSLFASRRIFEVDDGKGLGTLPEKYQRHVEPEDEAEVILLIISEKPLQKELGAAYKLARSVPYEAAPYWPNQRVTWLQKLARDAGGSIDADAAGLLVDRIDDEEELRAELDKLLRAAEALSPSTKKRVDFKLVSTLSVDEGGKGMLNLLDAAAKCDVSSALKSFAELRDQGELIPVLSALHKRFRGAMLIARLGDEAAKAVHLTPFQTRTASAMARLYGAPLLSAAVAEISRLSWAERSGAGEGWEGLEKLILAIMSRARRV